MDPFASNRRFMFYCIIFGSAWLLLALSLYQNSSLFRLQPEFEQPTPPGFSKEVFTAAAHQQQRQAQFPGEPATTTEDSSILQVSLQEADEQWLQQHVSNIISSIQFQQQQLSTKATQDQKTTSNKKFVQAPKLVDRQYYSTTYENIPGVEDVHAELTAYESSLSSANGGKNFYKSVKEALMHQQRTTTTTSSMSSLLIDPMNETDSIPTRVAFINDLLRHVQQREAALQLPSVCIASTTAVSTLLGVRRELLPWFQYHIEIGVTKFYLLYDGTSEQVVDVLNSIDAVELIHIHPPWASAVEMAVVAGFNVNVAAGQQQQQQDVGGGDGILNTTAATISGTTQMPQASSSLQWEGRPGNYELMVKQGHCLEVALARAKQASSASKPIDWLIHLDPDELLHPSSDGGSFSISAVLKQVPSHYPSARFMNFEGQPESADVVNRYQQVTLFRAHKYFITPESFFWRNRFVLGENMAWLILFANGKSAVRVDAPGVRHLGPHFFTGAPDKRWISHDDSNPHGIWRDYVSHNTIVLHYAYSYLSDVKEKSSRSCPKQFVEAALKGDVTTVKNCFVIDFDRDAFLAASRGTEAAEEFYYSRMVMTEGSPVRCVRKDQRGGGKEEWGWCGLQNIERLKFLLEKVGLLKRVYVPQVLLMQHEQRIRERMGLFMNREKTLA